MLLLRVTITGMGTALWTNQRCAFMAGAVKRVAIVAHLWWRVAGLEHVDQQARAVIITLNMAQVGMPAPDGAWCKVGQASEG